MFAVIIGIAVVLLEITALLFLIRAIRTARTAQGAVGWAIFLIFMPILAVPAYVFFGSWRYHGYIVARRHSKRVIEGLREQAVVHRARDVADMPEGRAFEAIAGLPATRGNDMTLLPTAHEAFGAMFEAIAAAEHYALVQFYIIRDDALGRRLHAAMIAAASRGVTVRLLYDAVGSKGLPADFLNGLREAGVAVNDTNRLFGPKTRLQINFRNHRKTVVVDGTVGFTGGFNVGDEYAGKDPRFGNWRDTHCRLTGPMVTHLQLVFAEDWYGATEETLIDALNWRPGLTEPGMDGLIMATGPADEMDTGALYFCAAINAARGRLWIASPYLVVENDILSALKLAALRGVEVRLLVPKQRDHWSTWLAAFAYFDELREAGVEIWRYADGFMHQKVVLVDDRIASVGTTNLDNRSCRLNFEATAMLFDEDAATAVRKMLEADFRRSERLETPLPDQPFHIRYGAAVAKLFAPLL